MARLPARPGDMLDHGAWRKPDYLGRLVLNGWEMLAASRRGPQGEAALVMWVEQLASAIRAENRLDLLEGYHTAWVQTKIEGPSLAADGEFSRLWMLLYQDICVAEQRILMGLVGRPLWIPMPATLMHMQEGISQLWLRTGTMAKRRFAWYSGDPAQQGWDRLLVPTVPPAWQSTIADMHVRATEMEGGWPESPTRDDFHAALGQALAGRHYRLAEGRPVLVRLDGHHAIKEVILMQKADQVLVKVLFAGNLDSGYRIDLTTGEVDDDLVETRNYGRDYAVPILLADIYGDLIGAEEVGRVRSVRRRNGARRTTTSPPKPTTPPARWQIIPRRVYIAGSKSETLADRTNITPAEQAAREALRRYHAVVGHVRRLPEGWHHSDTQASEAQALGIPLAEGETWVRPHDRGVRDTTGEIDLRLIPHYLRRPLKT